MSDQTWRNIINNHPIQQSIRQFLNQFPLKTHRSLYRGREFNYPKLYIWGPSWKPGQKTSFDQECLKWQTFLKFSNDDFDDKNSNEPLMSPSGKLPFLVLTTSEVLVDDDIEKYVNEKNPEILESLSTEQQADAQALIALADSKLRNALLYYLWCEPANEIITHKKYVGHYAKPLDKILFLQYKNLAVKELLARKAVLDKEEIYREAIDALQAISVSLGESETFFFNSRSPTFVDAVIFSYIHVILSLPIISTNELNASVQRYSNLVAFSKRIHDEYFSKDFF